MCLRFVEGEFANEWHLQIHLFAVGVAGLRLEVSQRSQIRHHRLLVVDVEVVLAWEGRNNAVRKQRAGRGGVGVHLPRGWDVSGDDRGGEASSRGTREGGRGTARATWSFFTYKFWMRCSRVHNFECCFALSFDKLIYFGFIQIFHYRNSVFLTLITGDFRRAQATQTS